jgi:GGDEF domain-containing protein
MASACGCNARIRAKEYTPNPVKGSCPLFIAEALLKRADEGMYAAKMAGKRGYRAA